MYQNSIQPNKVHEVLGKHILADGYDIVLDMEKSSGVRLYDSKGNREILDLFTCFASMPIGFNHPKMVNDQAFMNDLMQAALTNPSNSDIYTTQFAKFVETFDRVGIPSYLKHAFFVAGGALAVENALKISMDWKVQKNFEKGITEVKGMKVIHFKEAFHGRTGYTMSLTNTDPTKTKWFAQFKDWPRISNPKIHFPLTEDKLADLEKREAQAISEIKEAFKNNPDEICAIILEPIQAEGGDNHFRIEFMEQLRKLADENEAMLIFDEVQSGVGLTGKFWAHEHFGENARPDIISFGKKMQVCGVLVGERVDEVENNVFKVSSRINSTWGGNLVDMVRSAQVLSIIEEDNLIENAKIQGDYLLSKLQELTEKYSDLIDNPRGRGLMAAFDFKTKEQRNQFLKRGLELNTMFLGCAERTIRFRPALNITQAELAQGMEVMETILKEF